MDPDEEWLLVLLIEPGASAIGCLVRDPFELRPIQLAVGKCVVVMIEICVESDATL